MHQPYHQLFGHSEDFRVKYRLYGPEEGGRFSLPHQGIRFNFWYECADHRVNGQFLIYPEFEDEEGNLIEDGEVLNEGTARMWVLSPAWRTYHRTRITVGAVGYFAEGGRYVGVCEVIGIAGLWQNPTE